jgi:hypothetical protein
MTKARLDGLYLLLLGSLAFLLLGTILANTSLVAMVDFRVLYYPARCLIHHGDPYNESELLRMTLAETGDRPEDVAKAREVMRYIYLPTAFFLTVPFAMLPWGPAHILWMALIVGSLIFASFLIWNVGADYAPVASGALIGFFLLNSELLVVAGNMAGVAISFCVVAVWCFLRKRFVPVGILCLAIALAVKPHDTGLVWLYFLLAGGVHRKRALQTLLVAVALSLPGVLWVWHVAPHWIQGLHSNLLADSVHGGTNDPGLTSTGAHGLGMMVNLQTVISAIWDDPRIYNTATYLICGALLLIWSVTTLRFRSSLSRAWLALAAIAALSMLPFYHRQQDTRLILLTVPACVMLWAEGGLIGWLALMVNTAGFVLAGDIPWIVFLSLIDKLHLPATRLSGRILTAVQVFPVPLILLTMSVYYLWVYVRRCSAQPEPHQDLAGSENLAPPIA